MTKEQVTNDPWAISPEEIARQRSQFSTKDLGLICPKRNASIKGECKVCDYINAHIPYKKFPDEHPATKWKNDHRAKANYFANVVFPENIDKSIILEIGKKAGDAIQFKCEKEGWGLWVAHPKAGKGRELKISKYKVDGYNTYNPSPELEAADYDIPNEVLDNLPALDNIISMIKNGELNDNNHFKISSIKEGETKVFRICPGSKNSSNPQMFIIPVWRHWGVTQEQIDGTDPIPPNVWELSDGNSKSDENTVWQPKVPETPQTNSEVSSDAPVEKPVEAPVEAGQPPEKKDDKPTCFGVDVIFDKDDDQCKSCSFIKECAREIDSKKNGDIPF